MHHSARPHVSGALVQLRTTVTWSALAVMLAALLQMLSFGFVHFTDVRWTLVRPARLTDDKPKRVLSRWDGTLRTFMDASASVGLISVATLWLAIMLGVVVAGGSSVPGVEHAVRASTWATILAMSAVPLVVALPGLPLDGAFVSYQTLLHASEGSRHADTVSLLAAHLALPLVAAVLAGYALYCFREGVEAGVIVQSVSELDRKLDKELETIRASGISSNHGQRSVGAVDRPIGDTGESVQPKARSWVSDRDRSLGDSSSGNPLRRPM